MTQKSRPSLSPSPRNASEVAALPYTPELLQALHILTRDGRLNQDSRRKLKQVEHLLQFIWPLLQSEFAQASQTSLSDSGLTVVDHGAGKSYLGFLLYDRYFKGGDLHGQVIGVEARVALVERAQALAQEWGFSGMRFLAQSVADSGAAPDMPARVDVVTALHACDTATDDAIAFALQRQARHVVLVPCCQAELAACLRAQKAASLQQHAWSELWRHPLHTRELGSHITNVLRCLQLEAHGYKVSVTELVGWEHSMKNELIIASRHPDVARRRAATRVNEILDALGLSQLRERFFVPAG